VRRGGREARRVAVGRCQVDVGRRREQTGGVHAGVGAVRLLEEEVLTREIGGTVQDVDQRAGVVVLCSQNALVSRRLPVLVFLLLHEHAELIPRTRIRIEVQLPPEDVGYAKCELGPFAGRVGQFVTTRQLRERLIKELERNVALRVEETDQPDVLTVPLAFPVARGDEAMVEMLSTWIGLKQRDKTLERLYQHWILGLSAAEGGARWSIIRDVLHWVE